jgi:hypothetical protein
MPSFSEKKAKNKQSVPEWQSWEKNVLDRRFRLIVQILGSIGIVIALTVGIFVGRILLQRRTVVVLKPSLVNEKAPELLQPLTYSAKEEVRSGEVATFLKNTGNSQAVNIIPTFTLRVVPERSPGIPDVGKLPRGLCRDRALGLPMAKEIAAGDSTSPRLAQSTAALPQLLKGQMAQLFGVSCAFYNDASGTNHATCDTYKFRMPNGNAAFTYDSMPKTGKFDATPILNCSN